MSTYNNKLGTENSLAEHKKWNQFDFAWVLNLFGTAVGAGVLFLPMNAGMGGIWPLIIMTLLVGPMTYLAHRGLSRFVRSSKNPGSDITEVVEEHFGALAGKLITLLYFFAIFPILLIYGVGVTNTVLSFIKNQLNMAEPSRVLVSFVLIASLISVMLMGERIMLKVTEWLVYPLIAILLGMSIYLIPHWQLANLSLQQIPDMGRFITTLCLTIPVLVFAFNHSPAISSFTLSQLRRYESSDVAENHSNRVLFATSGILLIFVMFFVFSCVLTLPVEELARAKQENLPILSFLANKFDNPYISYVGPFVAFLAITSSFFGHYLGAREGLAGLIVKFNRDAGRTEIDHKKLNYISAVFFLVSLWIVAVVNPNILNLIESLGGPIIAMILFIMPIYATYTLPTMKRYRKEIVSNMFVLIMGSIAILSILYKLFIL